MDENEDYSTSRSAFFKTALSGHAWLWIAGIISLVFFAGDFSEQFVKPKVDPDLWKSRLEWLTVIGSWPTYLWAIVVLLVLLIGSLETSFRLYRAARKRGDEAITAFEAYKTKQLELTWEPTEEPYRWWDMKNPDDPVLYFRLRIKNISGVTVNGIKVELSELEPKDLACVPCPMRFMNNILPQSDPVLTLSLNPGDKNFIDLMLQSRKMKDFWILHAVKHYGPEVSKKGYRMTIRVSAIDMPEIVRAYRLVEDGDLWNLKEVTTLTAV